MYLSLLDLLIYVSLGLILGIAFTYFHFQFGNRIDWKSWAFFVIGSLLVALALGWLYASIGEQETRAGLVGLIMFAVPGIILGTLGIRLMKPVKELE